jgi:hypothetical protein
MANSAGRFSCAVGSGARPCHCANPLWICGCCGPWRTDGARLGWSRALPGASLSGRVTTRLSARPPIPWVLDKPLNEKHLRGSVRSCVAHYNKGRPHASLGPGIPILGPTDLFLDRDRGHKGIDCRATARSELRTSWVGYIMNIGWKNAPLEAVRAFCGRQRRAATIQPNKCLKKAIMRPNLIAIAGSALCTLGAVIHFTRAQGFDEPQPDQRSGDNRLPLPHALCRRDSLRHRKSGLVRLPTQPISWILKQTISLVSGV